MQSTPLSSARSTRFEFWAVALAVRQQLRNHYSRVSVIHANHQICVSIYNIAQRTTRLYLLCLFLFTRGRWVVQNGKNSVYVNIECPLSQIINTLAIKSLGLFQFQLIVKIHGGYKHSSKKQYVHVKNLNTRALKKNILAISITWPEIPKYCKLHFLVCVTY